MAGPDSSTETTETTESTESWRLVQLPCGDPAGRCSTKQRHGDGVRLTRGVVSPVASPTAMMVLQLFLLVFKSIVIHQNFLVFNMMDSMVIHNLPTAMHIPVVCNRFILLYQHVSGFEA